MGKAFLATVIVLTLAALANAQKNRFNFESRIGVTDINPQKELCLTILNSNISVGSRITLIAADKPQSLAEAVVEKRLPRSCSSNPDVPQVASFYLLKLTKGSSSFFNDSAPVPPSIAVFSPSNPIRIVRRIVSADLNGDGRREYFRQCTSNEGVHLTVWSGKPLRGKRVWHWYYYLGYDVEPSCQKKDYQE
jgi:hypothetical protein